MCLKAFHVYRRIIDEFVEGFLYGCMCDVQLLKAGHELITLITNNGSMLMFTCWNGRSASAWFFECVLLKHE